MRILGTLLCLAMSTSVAAQWLNLPTPGIPRTASPISRLWMLNAGPGHLANIAADVNAQPWADELYKQRLGNLGKDDPWTARCLPAGPRAILKGGDVSDATFQAIREKVGEKGIVDPIGLVGFYQTVSPMMNVDRFPLTSNQKPELEPLAKPLPFSSNAQPGGERFKPLTAEEMTPPQKALMDLMVSGKIEGGTRGPLNVLLRSPELGEGILRYGAYERFHTPLAAI